MVSKACVVGAYQKKLEELARLPGVDLTVVVPPKWRDPSGTLLLEHQHTRGYDLVVLPCAFNGSYHLHFYPGLGRLLRRLRPDLVHLDEEPYNLATAHGLRLARRCGAKTVFFSWQNILRHYPMPFSLLEWGVLRSADAGIVGNQESLEVWRAKGYRGLLAVIPQFGVDPDLYSPPAGGRPREPGQELVIGFVGRLSQRRESMSCSMRSRRWLTPGGLCSPAVGLRAWTWSARRSGSGCPAASSSEGLFPLPRCRRSTAAWTSWSSPPGPGQTGKSSSAGR